MNKIKSYKNITLLKFRSESIISKYINKPNKSYSTHKSYKGKFLTKANYLEGNPSPKIASSDLQLGKGRFSSMSKFWLGKQLTGIFGLSSLFSGGLMPLSKLVEPVWLFFYIPAHVRILYVYEGVTTFFSDTIININIEYS